MKARLRIKYIFDSNGNKIDILMSFKQFVKLMKKMEGLEDVITVYKHAYTRKKIKTIPYEHIRKELFGDDTK